MIERVVLVAVLIIFGSSANAHTLENDAIRVEVDEARGCLTVLEKDTGHMWQPDPWEGAIPQFQYGPERPLDAPAMSWRVLLKD